MSIKSHKQIIKELDLNYKRIGQSLSIVEDKSVAKKMVKLYTESNTSWNNEKDVFELMVKLSDRNKEAEIALIMFADIRNSELEQISKTISKGSKKTKA